MTLRSIERPALEPARIVAHLIEVPHFVMERRMLLGLKQRAEGE